MAAKKTPASNDAHRYKRDAEKWREIEAALPLLAIPEIRRYLGTFAAAWHVAHHGFKRSDAGSGGGVGAVEPSAGGAKTAWVDEGGTTHITRSRGGESKPPTYNSQAMGLVRAELRGISTRERSVIGKLSTIVDNEKPRDRDAWAA